MPVLSASAGGGGRSAEEQRKEKRHPRPAGRRRRRRTSADGGGSGLNGSTESSNYYSSDHHSSSQGGSLFSSAAGSVADRRSFGADSDIVVASQINLLAGSKLAGAVCGPAPDSDPSPGPSFTSPFPFPGNHVPANPSKGSPQVNSALREEEEVEEEEEEEEEKEESLGSTNYSFSKALRECKNLKCRSEAPAALTDRKIQRPRPASVDFNGQGTDASILSPQFFGSGVAGRMKSSTVSSRSRSGMFPTPGTPNYWHGSGVAGYQKGWSSERVPLPSQSTRRYGGSGVFLPFNNGRTLPSKWEDAEKWILSPVSGDGAGRSSIPPAHLRRPKSKSGPLGTPPGIGAAYLSASPLVPCFDSGRVGNFTANSPFLAGVLMPVNSNSVRSGTGRGGAGGVAAARSYSANGEPYIGRSASLHGWSDTLIESSSSVPSSRDEKSEGTREAASLVSPSTLKKDAATQMSPEESNPSSPKKRLSFSHSPQSAQPVGELESHLSKLEVRDVQVDDRVTVTRWSKKHIARGSDGRPTNIVEWKKKTVESETSTWEATETSKSVSKYKREEAKITAWENLQKAKAEAEIRKLEMKLEKKRSSSMDKILNKFRSAQKKAQELRSAANAKQGNQDLVRTPKKGSYFWRNGQISSLSGCFPCKVF